MEQRYKKIFVNLRQINRGSVVKDVYGMELRNSARGQAHSCRTKKDAFFFAMAKKSVLLLIVKRNRISVIESSCIVVTINKVYNF